VDSAVKSSFAACGAGGFQAENVDRKGIIRSWMGEVIQGDRSENAGYSYTRR